MPMPVSVPACACGHPAPAGPPLVVVVVLRVPADRPESVEPAVDDEPVSLDIGLALRRLPEAALAPTTRRLYADALRRFETWLHGRPADDAMLKAYLDELSDRGLAAQNGVLAVAAVARAALECARAGRECSADPVGPMTRERLERFRRDGAGSDRGQVRGLTWEEVERMCGLAEGDDDPRGSRAAAILGVAADGLMRVSEVSGLDAGDVSFLADGTAEAVIRRSKTDQRGRGEVAHVGAVAAERLRSWMEVADVRHGPPVPAGGPFRKCPGPASRAGLGARRDQAPRGPGGHPGPGVRPFAAHRHGAEAGRRGHVARRDSKGGPLEAARDAGLLRARPGGVPGRGGAAAGRRKKIEKSRCAARNGGGRVRLTRVNRTIS